MDCRDLHEHPLPHWQPCGFGFAFRPQQALRCESCVRARTFSFRWQQRGPIELLRGGYNARSLQVGWQRVHVQSGTTTVWIGSMATAPQAAIRHASFRTERIGIGDPWLAWNEKEPSIDLGAPHPAQRPLRLGGGSQPDDGLVRSCKTRLAVHVFLDRPATVFFVVNTLFEIQLASNAKHIACQTLPPLVWSLASIATSGCPIVCSPHRPAGAAWHPRPHGRQPQTNAIQ